MSEFLQKNRNILSVSLILLILGLTAAVWVRTCAINAAAGESNPNQNLIDVINQLEAETLALETEIDTLRTALAGSQLSSAETDEYIARLQSELSQMQLLSGQTAVSGSGIVITLNDNTIGAEAAKQTDPANYFPENYIIHDTNLRYLLNDISYMAEAIAINGQRIIDHSDIRCVGTVIIINSTRVAPPYEISLLGPATLLEAALQESAQYIYLKNRNMPIKVERRDELILPAYTGIIINQYTQPVNQ